MGASHGPFISIPTIREEQCVFSQVTPVSAHGGFIQHQVTLEHLQEMYLVPGGDATLKRKFTPSIMVSNLDQDLHLVSSHLINLFIYLSIYINLNNIRTRI